MGNFLFETWMSKDDKKHNTLTFNDMLSVMQFATDFIHEHKAWGEWINNSLSRLDEHILYLRTKGNNKDEWYNMRITEI